MYKVKKTFICRGCMIPETGTGCTSVDIGVDANLELVDNFYCLGDLFSVDDAAVETTIQTGWNKFRHLVPLLTNKDISLYPPSEWSEPGEYTVFTRDSVAIARICHGNSVCPSVRPSVTWVDQSKTVEARIMQFSP